MAWFDNRRNNLHNLETEIDLLLEEMAITNRDSEEYERMAGSLEDICKAKSYEKTPAPIDWNGILVNLTGIIVPVVIILNYEKLDVIASKGFQLLRKVH